MYNRRYDKAFVMLNQETNGFSQGNKPAWGSAAMEIKNGKGYVTLSVSELKILPLGREYVLYVIAGKKGEAEGVRCGTVPLDKQGRGDFKWEFNPDNIGGSSRTAEELHTIAILVEGRDSYGLVAPIAGYYGDTVNWKKHFAVFNEKASFEKAFNEKAIIEKPSIEKPLYKKSINEKANNDEGFKAETSAPTSTYKAEEIEDKADESAVSLSQEKRIEAARVSWEQSAKIQELKKAAPPQKTISNEPLAVAACEAVVADKGDFHKNFKDMMHRFNDELKELQSAGVLSAADKAQIDAAGEQPKTYTVDMNDHLSYICKQNTVISPFENDERQWRCIAMEELAVLPIAFLNMMRQPFLILPYRKYKHFIFGWDKAGSCFLGVPDNYRAENRRLAESLNFQTFLPCKNGAIKQDTMGYWLLEIKQAFP